LTQAALLPRFRGDGSSLPGGERADGVKAMQAAGKTTETVEYGIL